MQATSCFSPGLGRLFVLIKDFQEVCKCQRKCAWGGSLNTSTQIMLLAVSFFHVDVNITEMKKLFSALKKKKKAANLVTFYFYDIAKVLNVV